MYRNLADYETPAWVEEKAAKMGGEGYHVERYDPRRHVGLEEMVAALDNTMWLEEIPAAGKSGMDLLVGLKGNVCAGFTGPVYPEKRGGAILPAWGLRRSLRARPGYAAVLPPSGAGKAGRSKVYVTVYRGRQPCQVYLSQRRFPGCPDIRRHAEGAVGL